MTTRSWATAQTACRSEGAARQLSPGRLDDGRTAASLGATSDLTLVMARFEVAVLPFGHDHWLVAWAAFLRYGKGRHPADLNFGDCLTYAVAKLSGLPLLCVGSDFAQTDLMLVPLNA